MWLKVSKVRSHNVIDGIDWLIRMRKRAEWTEGTTESFTLKIDLLKITPTQIIQLKSDTVKAKNNSVVEYKFGFRATPESEIISYTLKINPIIIKEKPLLMQFKLNLFQDDTEMLEKVVQLKEHESVMVELMENKETGEKLSFRLTPSIIIFIRQVYFPVLIAYGFINLD